VHVERDAVARVVVHARVPDLLREVVGGQLEGLRQVVQGDDDVAGGVGRQLVQVHDPDVGALARLHGGRHALVEVAPLDGVAHHLDVLVLLVELGDELLHEGPVTTGEAVPVRQLDVLAVVGAVEGLSAAALGRAPCCLTGGLAATAGDDRQAGGEDRGGQGDGPGNPVPRRRGSCHVGAPSVGVLVWEELAVRVPPR